MRVSWAAVAAGAVALVGVAGLIAGAVPQSAASESSTRAQPIVVSGAYVREPASPDVAAAYFTVYNTTGTDDSLTAVVTGAGAQAIVHADDSGVMRAMPEGLRIPAHSSVTLAPGRGHIMIEKLYGPLRPGQTVNIELTFADAGTVVVTAPVVALTAPAPSVQAPQ